MAQQIRLGPVTSGTIDETRALLQLDQTDFQDLELSAENRNLILNSVTDDVIPGGDNPAFGTSANPWPSITTNEASIAEGSAKIHQTSNQSISSGSVTTVSFDSEDTDHTQGDVLTVDTANNEITIEKNGRYIIKTNVTILSPDDGQAVQTQVKLGAEEQDQGRESAGGTSRISSLAYAIVEVSSAPVDVTATIFQDAGTSKDTGGSLRQTNLSVGRIG